MRWSALIQPSISRLRSQPSVPTIGMLYCVSAMTPLVKAGIRTVTLLTTLHIAGRCLTYFIFLHRTRGEYSFRSGIYSVPLSRCGFKNNDQRSSGKKPESVSLSTGNGRPVCYWTYEISATSCNHISLCVPWFTHGEIGACHIPQALNPHNICMKHLYSYNLIISMYVLYFCNRPNFMAITMADDALTLLIFSSIIES